MPEKSIKKQGKSKRCLKSKWHMTAFVKAGVFPLLACATSRTPDPGSVIDVQRGIASLVISEVGTETDY